MTELRIEGLRTIEALRLPLRGMTVLIGDNGGGKSSVIEALELLRKVGAGTFKNDFFAIHDGPSLLRHDSQRLRLGVTIEGESRLFYDLVVALRGVNVEIEQESLREEREGSHGRDIFRRGLGIALSSELTPQEEQEGYRLAHLNLSPFDPLLGSFGMARPPHAIERATQALASLDVQLPFEVMPSWLARSNGRTSEMRQFRLLRSTSRLARQGANLIEVFQKLRNQPREHWEQTLNLVRMGLGEHIEQILVDAPENASPGTIGMWLKLHGRDTRLSLHQLSDGQLAYLCFVALHRAGLDQRSALAFDEPELHLHPDLLARVTDFFVEMSQAHPVLVATHSRRLLDRLGDQAAQATVLCELDLERNRTLFSRPDAAGLAAWLDRYDGLGGMLDAGLTRHVMLSPDQELNSMEPLSP